MDHHRHHRSDTPERDRRPLKRKIADRDPNDIGQDLRSSRAASRRPRSFISSLEERFQYYEAKWNLNLGERLLTHAEFRVIAEELDTTNILRVHTEGMRRHREDEVRKNYRMVKPTVIPTSPPIPRGPRADSSSSSPWPSQTSTPRRESTASSVAPLPEPKECNYSPTKPTPRRESSSCSAPLAAAEPQKPKQSPLSPAFEDRITKAPLDPPNIIIRPIERRISRLSTASGAANPQSAASLTENAPECKITTSSQPVKEAPGPTPTPLAPASSSPEIISRAPLELEEREIISSLELEEKLSGDATAVVKLPPPRLGKGVRKTSPRIGGETETEVQPLPQLQAPPPPINPFPVLETQTEPQPQSQPQSQPQTPPPPPPPIPSPTTPTTPTAPQIKQEHPPSPSILTEVTARIHHRRVTFLAERRAAHAEKVIEAKAKCWEGARGLVGEVGCLNALVGAAMETGGEGRDGERDKDGEDGGLFVPYENEGDANTNLEQKGAGEAGKRHPLPLSLDDLTEPLLLRTLTSLIAWEDNARSVRRRQEEVVVALEGMGMDAEEAKKVVGRLGGVMARVAGVRWGLEDCLVLMGGEGG